MYNEYRKQIVDANEKYYVSYDTMREYFNKKKLNDNIIISKPYADYCNTCSVYMNNMKCAESEEEYNAILSEYKLHKLRS